MGGIEAGIEIQRCNDRFVDIFKRRVKTAPSRALLRRAEHDDICQAQPLGDLGKVRSRHERHLDARQPAFVEIVKPIERLACHDSPEHAVAEEFESFVGIPHRTPLVRRRMGYRGEQELLVFKVIADD